jgi:hypothetical protein
MNEWTCADLILKYQFNGDPKLLGEVVEMLMPLVESQIHVYAAFEEWEIVRSDCAYKLLQILPKFDPTRGRVFSFITFAIRNFLLSRGQKLAGRRSRESVTDPVTLERMSDARPTFSGLSDEQEELVERIRGLVYDRPPWQWGSRWKPIGTIERRRWNPRWQWQEIGTVAA